MRFYVEDGQQKIAEIPSEADDCDRLLRSISDADGQDYTLASLRTQLVRELRARRLEFRMIKAAALDIFSALRAGKVHCTGVPHAGGDFKHTQIGPEFWTRTVEIFLDEARRGSIRVYTELQVEREAIRAIREHQILERQIATASQRQGTPPTDAEVTDELARRLQQASAAGHPIKTSQYRKDFCRETKATTRQYDAALKIVRHQLGLKLGRRPGGKTRNLRDNVRA